MKMLFCGYGRAGKDISAMEISRITGLRYGGSLSWHAKEYMAEVLGVHPQQAWTQRSENRELWKQTLDSLRLREGQTHLSRLALASGDIVTGLRDRAELLAAQKEKLFDKIVWVERPGIPRDYTVTFGSGECDETILNDGTLEEFYETLANWAGKAGLI